MRGQFLDQEVDFLGLFVFFLPAELDLRLRIFRSDPWLSRATLFNHSQFMYALSRLERDSFLIDARDRVVDLVLDAGPLWLQLDAHGLSSGKNDLERVDCAD